MGNVTALGAPLDMRAEGWPSRRVVVWLALSLNCSLWLAIGWGASFLI